MGIVVISREHDTWYLRGNTYFGREVACCREWLRDMDTSLGTYLQLKFAGIVPNLETITPAGIRPYPYDTELMLQDPRSTG